MNIGLLIFWCSSASELGLGVLGGCGVGVWVGILKIFVFFGGVLVFGGGGPMVFDMVFRVFLFVLFVYWVLGNFSDGVCFGFYEVMLVIRGL